MHPPTSHFQKCLYYIQVFHNFEPVSSLDGNKPYALSNAWSKMCEQIASYLAKHSELGSKNFQQNLAENYSKSIKIAFTACKFLIFFGGSMPPHPHEAFFVSQSVSNECCRKNIHLKKNVEIMASPFQNFSLRYWV